MFFFAFSLKCVRQRDARLRSHFPRFDSRPHQDVSCPACAVHEYGVRAFSRSILAQHGFPSPRWARRDFSLFLTSFALPTFPSALALRPCQPLSSVTPCTASIEPKCWYNMYAWCESWKKVQRDVGNVSYYFWMHRIGKYSALVCRMDYSLIWNGHKLRSYQIASDLNRVWYLKIFTSILNFNCWNVLDFKRRQIKFLETNRSLVSCGYSMFKYSKYLMLNLKQSCRAMCIVHVRSCFKNFCPFMIIGFCTVNSSILLYSPLFT